MLGVELINVQAVANKTMERSPKFPFWTILEPECFKIFTRYFPFHLIIESGLKEFYFKFN